MLFTHMVEREHSPLSNIFRAVSDPTRRRILVLVAQHGPQRIGALSEHFDISLNSVSKHIKVLESAGLVSRRTEWREHLIALEPQAIDLVEDWFAQLRSIWELRLEALDELLAEKGNENGSRNDD